ncbi:MAG: bifunctional diaminohydroxyphosphoribosylaminopyrimidine deaminase/5-amino-6-(5-phosphoribosylamino)uracil reductase RibD [bacterium]
MACNDRAMLDLAARLAVRGAGHVEPNPMVGCVICRAGSGPAAERIIGMGHHRRFGGVHAEVEALGRCKALGQDPRGGTMYVTLEPCNVPGRNGACVDAVLGAGIAEVVCARRDPSPGKGGGSARLERAGVRVRFTGASTAACRLAEPWVKRLETGLPWVIAKWAQSIDGCLTTGPGQGRWITSPRSRHAVHQLRSRVDAIITGGGTVRADNPMLTARGVPIRRRAVPVVLTGGELPAGSHLAENKGTVVVRASRAGGAEGWRGVLGMLAGEHGVHTAMIEGGPGLLSSVLEWGLADELHVYTGGVVVGGGGGLEVGRLVGVQGWEVVSCRVRGGDVRVVYRRGGEEMDKWSNGQMTK